MKKVVITGATSMLGIALINKCLDNDVFVYAIVRKNSARINRIPKNKNVSIITVDFDQLDSIDINEQYFDVFYHFAWEGTNRKDRNSNVIQKKNVELTKNAIALAIKLKCEKFVGIGSQAEYGRKNHPIEETDAENPETEYGKAKLLSYRISKELAKTSGIKHIWVRVFSVYGELDKSDTFVSMLIEKMMGNEEINVTNCEQIWDYLYSEDAGRALYLIGEKGKEDQIYNLGSGEGKPLRYFAEIIRGVVNKEKNINYGTIPYSNDQPMYLLANTDKITKEIGWKPLISFEEGVRRIYRLKRKK